MKLTNFKNYSNICFLNNNIKVKQKIYFTFFLNKCVDLKAVYLFFKVKEKYIWLLAKQKLNVLESHAQIILNHLDFDYKIETYENLYRARVEVSYINLNLEEKILNINKLILYFFKNLNLNKLNIDNLNILKQHIKSDLSYQNFSYNKIIFQQNSDFNNLDLPWYIFLNSDGYNLDVQKYYKKLEFNNLDKEFLSYDKDFLNNICSFEYLFRTNSNFNDSNMVLIENIIKILKISEKKIMNFDLNSKDTIYKNYFLKNKVSTIKNFVTIDSENNIKDQLYCFYLIDLLYNYYYDQIREKQNLIYAPDFTTISQNKILILIENKTSNSNLNKFLDIEKKLFKTVLNNASKKSLNNFKQTLQNDFLEISEKLDIKFYFNLKKYYSKNCSNIEIEVLDKWYLNIIQDLNINEFLNTKLILKNVVQNIIKGN